MPEIRVTGIRELGAAFRQMDNGFNKELQRGLKGTMNQLLGRIRSKVPGSAGGSLKARATQRGGGIAFPAGGGVAQYDYYPWLDFGGSVGKGHRQGSPWSGSVKRERLDGGRYIYPTIMEERQNIEDAIGDVVIDLARRARFDTHG